MTTKTIRGAYTRKDSLIERILQADMDSMSVGETQHILDLLRNGFVGYRKMTIGELKADMRERGIV